ncbi:hypothetical protein, partial [Rhodoplanes roseus]
PAVPIPLTQNRLLMKVRRKATDHEAALELTTETGELTITDAPAGAFTLFIPQARLVLLPAATYVHSLLRITPDGRRLRMWYGQLIHDVGESR